ncbi:MAG: CpaF family protein [Nevskiales bacterium]
MSPELAAHKMRLSEQYQAWKIQLHRHLLQVIDDRNLSVEDWSRSRLARLVEDEVKRYVFDNKLAVNRNEIESLAEDALDELVGYGPIQALVDDPEVDDIVVNGAQNVFVERQGRLEEAPFRFVDDNHVIRVIQRILAPLGRRVDESSPMVDARLPDGSRVNAIIPPLALNGPCLSIRKFRKQALTAEELQSMGSVNAEMLKYLNEAVTARRNILVLGGTGSGKTTLLNLISQWISAKERVITIEDAAELRLENNHVVRLETRPPNLEGGNQVTARDLVRNALRMRPDRIIVGEIRGDEVLDMLQAMNTGHDGSMTTLHANNPHDAVQRLLLLAGFAGFNGSEGMLLQQVASALDIMVHVGRLNDGRRRVLSIARVRGVHGGELRLDDVFCYDQQSDTHRSIEEAAA